MTRIIARAKCSRNADGCVWNSNALSLTHNLVSSFAEDAQASFAYIGSSAQRESLVRLSKMCINMSGLHPGEDVDPITLEPFDEMRASDLDTKVIAVGQRNAQGKQYCFHVLSLYAWYEREVRSGRKRPLHPTTHVPLTDEDISIIAERMRFLDPNFTLPEPAKPLEIEFKLGPEFEHAGRMYVHIFAIIHISGVIAHTSHVTDVPVDLSHAGWTLRSVFDTLLHFARITSTLDELLVLVIGLRLRDVPPIMAADWYEGADTSEPSKAARDFLLNMGNLHAALQRLNTSNVSERGIY